jgi:hypothetical protein
VYNDHAGVVPDFADVAARFCHLIDVHADMTLRDFICNLDTILPELLYRGSLLPWPECDSDMLPRRDASSIEAEVDAALSLEDWLGEWGSYPYVIFPFDDDANELGEWSVARDLMEIYGDLEPRPLRHPDTGSRIPSRVVWSWRFGYESHWGDHAISAYRRVHWVMERLATEALLAEDD